MIDHTCSLSMRDRWPLSQPHDVASGPRRHTLAQLYRCQTLPINIASMQPCNSSSESSSGRTVNCAFFSSHLVYSCAHPPALQTYVVLQWRAKRAAIIAFSNTLPYFFFVSYHKNCHKRQVPFKNFHALPRPPRVLINEVVLYHRPRRGDLSFSSMANEKRGGAHPGGVFGTPERAR